MTGTFRTTTAALLLALSVSLGQRLELTEAAHRERQSLYLPSGRYLKWASLGFRGLLADGLYIWSLQYYSTERADRWRWLEQTFNVITDLDPRFLEAYSIGALVLSLESGRTDQAIGLLERGMKANPGRYLLPWEAAFYARDLGRSEQMTYFLAIAKDCPDAPSYVGRWHAYTLVETGRREEALAVWLEAYETARTDYERSVAERYVNSIRLEMMLERLRAAIDAFRTREGRWPRGLEELVHAGIIAQVPTDPLGRPLVYDPAQGTVRALPGFLKSRQLGS